MAQVSLVNDSQNNFLTADAYGSYERQEDHIYNVTDSYIGSDKKIERMEKILNLETMRIEEKEVTLPKGVENIFSEISSNAGDNVARSKRKGVNPGKIVISMTDEIVKVRNGGISIPIEMHKERNMWVPELIFGTLLSSVNYDKNVVRTECGRNGYGSKLTNIFSKEFTIIIADPRNGKLYHQVWNDNMNVKHDPTITDYPSDGESFVEIMYKLDFERFGYTCYPKEAYNIFARHAVDLSLTGRIPVIFNEHEFNIKSSREYAELYFGKDMAESSIVYYQWPKKTKTTTKNGVKYCEDTMIIPKTDICIVDTPDKAFCVAFSNGKWNTDGGVHVDAGYKAVSKGVLDTVNGKKQRKKIKLSTSDIKKHVTMFISCWVDNAEFSNQTKTKLTSPKIKITINDEVLTPIMKWDLVSRLHAELTAKHFKADSKTDGKKHRHISLNKLEDANKAGTYESHKCTLYVTEGASASSYAVKAIELDEKGRDYYGIYPMKGKPLNVMKALPEKIRANKEIQDLKEALGLKERVDYKIPENFKTLRYGQFMVLADADDDGKHILGLILNLFYCKFPSLLEIGYVKYLRTKILDVQKGNRKIKFYSKHEFDKWIKRIKNPDAWKVSYFKGLGTSEDHDIAEEFQNPKIVKCVYDDSAPASFNLAFHKDMANQRKKWIDTWVPNYKVEQMDIQPISQFINHEFIQFSIADNYRSIPKFIDGLKISQRKIIWGSMKKWKSKVGAHDAAQIKVDQLAAYVQGKTEYKHGGMSLEGAIKSMAQDFIGSNNMPYFCRHGQYGCVDPKTPILLWSGDTIKAEHVKVGDELVGDDGKKRTVSHVVSGIDDMYEISQTYGDSYIVNSIHILTLIIPVHRCFYWNDSIESWVLQYYECSTRKVLKKIFKSKESMNIFRDTLSIDNVIDIPLNEYIKLPHYKTKHMYGFKKMPHNLSVNQPDLSKITVKKVKRGKYCGWHIDGNERFLLGDYTVTHNTRNMLGKDASASRYIKTKPEWWWPFIYKKEDMNILEIIKDEGEDIEPKTLLPIIPMQLVNGALGIGTGHSTLIPSHNPLDICAWIQAKLTDKKLPPVFPWYRNFKGKISINVNKSKKSNTSSESTEELIKNTSSESTENSSSPKNISSESTEDNMLDVLGDSDEFLINKDTKYRMVTNGIFTVSEGRGKKVIITELPIGKATHKYTQWLNKMREQKIIKKFNSYSGSNKIHFEIYGMKNPSLRKLKLTSSFGLSNMVMLDSNNKPHKYNDTVDILETFYHIRLAYYEKRKTNILSELSITINKLNDKVRFIESVIKGNDILKIHPNITFEDANKENAILIMGQNKKNISSQLERLNFDISMMNVSLVQCTLEKIEDAKNKIQELVKERNIIENTSTKQLWFNDIELFIKRYCKEYKCKYIPVKKIILNIKNA